ncbi:hypothetical protein CALVIDRAFT_539515 [Calocera viscosa TUFC12733]|uniref:Uncharacterized protein n=1 Tax=Calocera viscosa (strain TUFC12733) TaxID=1330018 RepID=A0A167JSQ8_CALVF|nr:hypothetical protein CALVIDRAFT_539515 [Calocera viscosa TUFC12733]
MAAPGRSPRLPLELLYHIGEELARPPHPLSYSVPPASQHALIALSLSCHALYDFCMPLLYQRLCIESARRLRRLRRARPAHLAKLNALFLDFEHLEEEVRAPIPPSDADILGGSYRTFCGFSPRAALYYEAAEHLSFLISACRSSLQRLAFGSRGRPQPPWVSMDPIEERAVEHFASQANYAIASTLPGLRELICVRQNMEVGDYLGLGRSGGQRRWEKLERLAVYGTLSYNAHDAPPILPALECFCALHPFPSLALLSQAVTTSPNLRELRLFNVSLPPTEQTPSVRTAYTDLDRILEAMSTVGRSEALELRSVAGTRAPSPVMRADYEADTFTPIPDPANPSTSPAYIEAEIRKQPVHVTRLSLPALYDPRRPEDRRERTSLAARLGKEGLLWEWAGEDVGGMWVGGQEVVGGGVGMGAMEVVGVA